ncbi:MAG TPA: NUDIX domain-containing protein [Flavobacteriales bacterium]|jgi:predicted NUDIX family NTP pyrophosphohydrolase|nr:NUDIX domain-containing protein [Flavobacteriales bacterium]
MDSAGLVLFRRTAAGLEVLLGHMGGPFWARKHAGAWTIPKGELHPGEDAERAARREVHEELGLSVSGTLLPLPTITQRSGKRVHAWACELDVDPATVRSNTFTLEWPPRSGKQQEFPEIDRAAWFSIAEAEALAIAGQGELFRALERLLAP